MLRYIELSVDERGQVFCSKRKRIECDFCRRSSSQFYKVCEKQRPFDTKPKHINNNNNVYPSTMGDQGNQDEFRVVHETLKQAKHVLEKYAKKYDDEAKHPFEYMTFALNTLEEDGVVSTIGSERDKVGASTSIYGIYYTFRQMFRHMLGLTLTAEEAQKMLREGVDFILDFHRMNNVEKVIDAPEWYDNSEGSFLYENILPPGVSTISPNMRVEVGQSVETPEVKGHLLHHIGEIVDDEVAGSPSNVVKAGLGIGDELTKLNDTCDFLANNPTQRVLLDNNNIIPEELEKWSSFGLAGRLHEELRETLFRFNTRDLPRELWSTIGPVLANVGATKQNLDAQGTRRVLEVVKRGKIAGSRKAKRTTVTPSPASARTRRSKRSREDQSDLPDADDNNHTSPDRREGNDSNDNSDSDSEYSDASSDSDEFNEEDYESDEEQEDDGDARPFDERYKVPQNNKEKTDAGVRRNAPSGSRVHTCSDGYYYGADRRNMWKKGLRSWTKFIKPAILRDPLLGVVEETDIDKITEMCEPRIQELATMYRNATGEELTVPIRFVPAILGPAALSRHGYQGTKTVLGCTMGVKSLTNNTFQRIWSTLMKSGQGENKTKLIEIVPSTGKMYYFRATKLCLHLADWLLGFRKNPPDMWLYLFINSTPKHGEQLYQPLRLGNATDDMRFMPQIGNRKINKEGFDYTSSCHYITRVRNDDLSRPKKIARCLGGRRSNESSRPVESMTSRFGKFLGFTVENELSSQESYHLEELKVAVTPVNDEPSTIKVRTGTWSWTPIEQTATRYSDDIIVIEANPGEGGAINHESEYGMWRFSAYKAKHVTAYVNHIV